MNKNVFALLWAMSLSLLGNSQDIPKKDRYKMAQSYLGFEIGALAPFSGFAPNGPSPAFGFGRITLGGLHFWSKADFYISFPVSTFALGPDNGFSYSEGIITGARYIPFGLKRNVPRPYLGINWNTPRWQIGDGPQKRADRLGLETGFTMVIGKSVTLEAGIRYVLNQDQEYPFSKEVSQSVTAPVWGLHLGIKKYVDFTASYSSDAGKEYVRNTEKALIQKGGLSGWTVQAGLSATISLEYTDFGDGFSHLNNKPSVLHPDLGVGYYFHQQHWTLNVSYRPLKFSGEAFGDEYSHSQHNIHTEAFKMLFDWKGFAPFAGLFAGVSVQRFMSDIPNATDIRETMPTAGIIVGWDIRPSAVDWYYLRTNLRYMPLPAFGGSIEQFSTNQLEVNFIQFVFFPHRFKLQKS